MTQNPPKVAYLVSQYPAYSHGFVEAEIEAMRSLGVDVLPMSVNANGIPGHRDSAATKSFKGVSLMTLIPTIVCYFVRHPLVVLGALAYQILRQRSRSRRRLGILRDIGYVAEAVWFYSEIAQKEIEHLHVHFANAAADVGRLISVLDSYFEGPLRQPLTWSLAVHGPTDFDESDTNDLVGKVLAANFVACISNFARSRVQSMLCDRSDKARLDVVHMGVDTGIIETKNSSSLRERSDGDGLRVLFVGRLVSKKGIVDLVEVCRELNARGDPVAEVELVVIGDGPLRQELEILTNGSRWARLEGAQNRDRVFKWYEWADVLCLPSYSEGLPVVLMEAMAHSLPVISTDITGVPELVADGESGLLIEPGDRVALANALNRVQESATFRQELGSRGREKVESEFDSAVNARRLLDLIVSVRQKRGKG